MTSFKHKKIVIIGLGLIGGSIARALAEHKVCENVWAFGRKKEVLASAKAIGVIADYSLDLKIACSNADLIIVAVPGLTVSSVFAELAGFVDSSVTITDVASVKCSTVDAAIDAFGKVPDSLVPGHPIAGSEQSGFSAAKATLFVNKKVILTPLDNTRSESLSLVAELWRLIGAEVLTMSVQHHDEVLAATSHLPHLLAYALVDTLSQQGKSEEIFSYAAGGFRDFTRIASSDPEMWRDVFLANGDATITILDKFSGDLAKLREAIAEGDGDFIMKTFSCAKKSRDKFMCDDSGMDNGMDSGMSSRKGNNASENVEPEVHNLMFDVEPGGQLTGSFRVPGDKSISHRSIIFGSIAEGVTTVEGFLEGEDSLATLAAFRAMGVLIEGPDNGKLRIEGRGLYGLQAPVKDLYLGNSGTSMRLLTGLLAAQSFSSTLTGDESLSKRPMRRVCDPLQDMGANIALREGGLAPVEISAGKLSPIHYTMPVASAQVKSCLLLASLYVDGQSTIIEPAPCRDHTERMLQGFGYEVRVTGNKVEISGGGKLNASHIDVPADISSAAFFMVAASICPGSDITLAHVGINPTRIGVINILNAMGANIEYLREYQAGGEPVADIRIRYAALHGIDIPVDQVPLAIDEFPALFIAAACADGKTVLSGAEELRVKESDRIQAMADGLAILGVEHKVRPDGMVIHGRPEGQAFSGGTIDSKGDHRIAMAFAMAGLRASSKISLLQCNNVATSFPDFVRLSRQAGLSISEKDNE